MTSSFLRAVLGHPVWQRASRVTVLGRPLAGRSSWAAWVVLLSALPIGLMGYVRLFQPSVAPLGWEQGYMMGLNFHTYHVAAAAALAGGDLYAVFPPEWSAAYTYQYAPITVVTFYPVTVWDWWTGYQVFLVLTVFVSCLGTWLLVRYIDAVAGTVGWVDIGLIFVFVVFSTHTLPSVYYGNVNLFLAAGVIMGFFMLSRNRDAWAGVAFGVVALFKVFPALLGVWLVRMRAWRAVGAAVVTGIAGIGVGGLLFGVGTTEQFFREVLVNRAGSVHFIGGYPADGLYYVTVQRPLSHLIWFVDPNAHPAWLFACSFLVGAGVLAYFYADVSSRMDQLIAVFATLVVAIVLFPSYRLYLVLLYFPLVPMLYVWDGPGIGAFTSGGVLLSFTYRPGEIIEYAGDLPGLASGVVSTLATVATVQLYALTVMLIGCAIYKRWSGSCGYAKMKAWLSANRSHGTR